MFCNMYLPKIMPAYVFGTSLLYMKSYLSCKTNYTVYILGIASINSGSVATMTISGLECGTIYTITAQGISNNETIVGPEYIFGNVTTGSCLLVISEDYINFIRIYIYTEILYVRS